MALTCPNCGFAANQDIDTSCQNCGDALSQSSGMQTSTGDVTVSPRRRENGQGQSNELLNTETPYPRIPAQSVSTKNGISGRVTWIESSLENMDFNIYRFFSQSIFFLMFLPLLVGILSISFVLWVTFALIGFRGLASGVNPLSILSATNSLGVLLAIIFPRTPGRVQTTAQRLTLKTSQGEERAALVKGELISGTIRRGDEIELQGRWRNGTLVMINGVNRTLSTHLRLRRDHWNVIFFTLIVLITVALIAFLGA